MTKEEVIVQFIVDSVKSIQEGVNKNSNEYGDNDMMESLYIDSHLSYWYKNALAKVPTFASLLNIAPNDIVDLIKGIYNLAYEMYFGLDSDYDESFTLEYNSNLILSSLDKARIKLNEKQVPAIKEFNLFNVEDWEKPEVQSNKIFQLQKEIISRTLKQAASLKRGHESLSGKEPENIMPFYDSAYKLWSSQERIKQISERIDISEEVALASVEEAFVFIKQKGSSIVKDMGAYLKKEENIEILIQQIFDSATNKIEEGKDIAYVYFDCVNEYNKYQSIIKDEGLCDIFWSEMGHKFSAAIHAINIQITKYEHNLPDYLVEDIQNYKYGKTLYDGCMKVLNDLKSRISNKELLDTISMVEKCLTVTYERQLNSQNKSCYIATMAYQDINHPQVEYLRQVRDKKLLQYHTGQIFVKYYYRYSPRLVEHLEDHQIINKIIKTGLNTLICLLKRCSSK